MYKIKKARSACSSFLLILGYCMSATISIPQDGVNCAQIPEHEVAEQSDVKGRILVPISVQNDVVSGQKSDQAMSSSQDDRGDVDEDGIPDALEADLAATYCPHYYFHPDEPFYFFNPWTLLQSTGAQLNGVFSSGPDYCPDNPFQTTGPQSHWRLKCGDTEWYTADPADLPYVLRRINARDVHSFYPQVASCIDEHGWDNLRLVPPDNDFGYGDPDPCLKYHLNRNVPVYYLMEQNSEGNVELQFWQFSHYDRKGATFNIGDHWADWTRLVIVFEKKNGTITEPPMYVYYSAHRGYGGPDQEDIDCAFHPRYIFWNDVSKSSGTHPAAIVAKGSHELYFKTSALSWYPGVEYFQVGIPYDNCECKPFQIQNHVGNMYFDQIGIGQSFIPSNLVNLGNGDHPYVAWLTFGGHWGPGNHTQGPAGPLGITASVRLREHNICRDAPFDDGSWVNTYSALTWLADDERHTYCSYPAPDYDQPLVEEVLRPLQLDYTANRLDYERYVAPNRLGTGHFHFPTGSIQFAEIVSPEGTTINIYPGTYEVVDFVNSGSVVFDKRMEFRKWWGTGSGSVVIRKQ